MDLTGAIRIAVFLSSFLLLVRYVGFDRFYKRGSPARVFFYLFIALFVTGSVEWLIETVFGFKMV